MSLNLGWKNGHGQNRTADAVIFSHPLYLLSYISEISTARLELACIAAHGPKPCVSANSTTSMLNGRWRIRTSEPKNGFTVRRVCPLR